MPNQRLRWRLFLALVTVLLAAGRSAADCQDYLYPYSADFVPTSDRVASLCVQDERVYALTSAGEFLVLDASSPTNVSILGSVDIPADGGGMVARGSYVYIASVALLIVEVSDPASPRLVSVLFDPSWLLISDIVVHGQYAYVVELGSGVQIVDISDPESPILLPGSFEGAGEMVADSEYLYLGTSALYIFDLADPEHPAFVSRTEIEYHNFSISDVAVDGDFVYCSDSYGEHRAVVSVADPANPQLLQVDFAWGVSIAAQNGLVLSDVELLEASEPTNMVSLFRGQFEEFTKVALGKDAGFIGRSTGIEVISFRTQSCAVEIQRENVSSVGVSGDLVYVTSASAFEVFQQGEGGFELRGALALDGYVYGQDNEGQDVFLAQGHKLTRVDVSDPAHPFVAAVSTIRDGLLIDLDVSGGLLYAAALDGGISILDVSDSGVPPTLSHIDTEAWRLAESGGTLFVVNGEELVLVDVSDPMHPAVRGSAAAPGARAVCSENSVTFVGGDDLYIFDVADPDAPVLQTTVATVPLHDVLGYQGTIYAAASSRGAHVIDVMDTNAGHVVGSFSTMAARRLARSGDSILVADGAGGLRSFLRACSAPATAPETTGRASTANFRVFPNPTHGSVTLDFQAPFPGAYRAGVFDIGGRRIAYQTTQADHAGTVSMIWSGRLRDGSMAPAGQYVIRLDGPLTRSYQKLRITR